MGFRPGNDLLGNIQNTGPQIAVKGQAGHFFQDIEFQLLNFCLKLSHAGASSTER